MATDKAFLEELLAGLENVRVHPMMGEYVLYCNEKSVGCVCDNTLFVKITPASDTRLKGAPSLPPYLGAKPRYVVASRDRAFLQELLSAVADGLLAPKKKK